MAAPLNLSILDPTRLEKVLPEVTSTLIFDATGGTFHPDGLFSEEIFGGVTTPDRMNNFGRIALHTTVLHPKVFRSLTRLRRFYIDIMKGSTFAAFDAKSGAFVRAEEGDPNADTGYAFFMKHYIIKRDLKFPDTDSSSQGDRLALVRMDPSLITLKHW